MALGAYLEGQDYVVFYSVALSLIACIECGGIAFIVTNEKADFASLVIILQVGLRSFDMFSGIVESRPLLLLHFTTLVISLIFLQHVCIRTPEETSDMAHLRLLHSSARSHFGLCTQTGPSLASP